MDTIEDYALFDLEDLAKETEEDAVNEMFNHPDQGIKSRHGANLTMWKLMFPWRVLIAVICMALVYEVYYYKFCDCDGGTCVSKPIHAPLHANGNLWSYLFNTQQHE